jgi:hypothetical protein
LECFFFIYHTGNNTTPHPHAATSPRHYGKDDSKEKESDDIRRTFKKLAGATQGKV